MNSDFQMIKDSLQTMGIGKIKSCTQPHPSNICKQLTPKEMDECVTFFSLMKTIRLCTFTMYVFFSVQVLLSLVVMKQLSESQMIALQAGHQVCSKRRVSKAQALGLVALLLVSHRRDRSTHGTADPVFGSILSHY